MVVDTNILIACLEAEPIATETLSRWRKAERILFISSISIAEVLAAPNLNTQKGETIKEFLKNFISVPVDDQIAEIAGAIRSKYRIEIPDAVIAATALTRNAPLVTRDKEFHKVKELTVITL